MISVRSLSSGIPRSRPGTSFVLNAILQDRPFLAGTRGINEARHIIPRHRPGGLAMGNSPRHFSSSTKNLIDDSRPPSRQGTPGRAVETEESKIAGGSNLNWLSDPDAIADSFFDTPELDEWGSEFVRSPENHRSREPGKDALPRRPSTDPDDLQRSNHHIGTVLLHDLPANITPRILLLAMSVHGPFGKILGIRVHESRTRPWARIEFANPVYGEQFRQYVDDGKFVINRCVAQTSTQSCLDLRSVHKPNNHFKRLYPHEYQSRVVLFCGPLGQVDPKHLTGLMTPYDPDFTFRDPFQRDHYEILLSTDTYQVVAVAFGNMRAAQRVLAVFSRPDMTFDKLHFMVRPGADPVETGIVTAHALNMEIAEKMIISVKIPLLRDNGDFIFRSNAHQSAKRKLSRFDLYIKTREKQQTLYRGPDMNTDQTGEAETAPELVGSRPPTSDDHECLSTDATSMDPFESMATEVKDTSKKKKKKKKKNARWRKSKKRTALLPDDDNNNKSPEDNREVTSSSSSSSPSDTLVTPASGAVSSAAKSEDDDVDSQINKLRKEIYAERMREGSDPSQKPDPDSS